jgi:hypothetical protein
MTASKPAPPDLTDADNKVVHLPVKFTPSAGHSQSKPSTPEDSQASDSSDLAREYERFKLQVQLDIENERELLYKSLLVVQLLAFVFVLREILIRWFA